MNCTAHRTNGQPCKLPAINGAKVCRNHGGAIPQVRRKAAVIAEVMRWQLGDAVDDPATTLLRLVTQSRIRADFYARLLGEAFDAAERLTSAETSGDVELGADARRDLETVLSTGGVGVLIGRTWSAAGKEGTIFASGEAIRGLAMLEAAERDRCANFARIAVAADLGERVVRVAEAQAEVIVRVVAAALRAHGVDPELLAVQATVVRELEAAQR